MRGRGVMADIDELVGALAHEGQHLIRGEFVLDRDKAREKMSKFQLVDPYHYVLELVQAAHLLNASVMRFNIDADELELILEGERLEGLSAQQLELVYSAAFMRHQDRRLLALRHFGIALGAIWALNPLKVELVSVDGEQVHVFTQRVARGEPLEQVTTRARVDEQGLRFYVRERFRFGHLAEFLSKGVSSSLPEIALLIEAASMSMIPIYINGELIHDGRWLEPQSPQGVRLELDALQGWVELDLELGHIEAQVGQRGVWISQHLLPSPLPFGARVRVLSSGLSTDLSQRAFVQDESWYKLLASLEDGLCAAAALWMRESASADDDARLDALLRATIELVHAKRRHRLTLGPGLLQLCLECERRPAWRCADGVIQGGEPQQLLPLKDFGVSVATLDAPLYYALVHVPEHRLAGTPQVLLKSSDQLHRVRAYLDPEVRTIDVTSALLSARERRERQQRLLKQPVFKPLDSEQWPVQVTLATDEAQVNVGWSATSWRCGLVLFHRLRVLEASDHRLPREVIAPDEEVGERRWGWSEPHQLWSHSDKVLLEGIKVQLCAELPTNEVISKPELLSEGFGQRCLLILEALSALMLRRFEQVSYAPDELKTFLALLAQDNIVDEVLGQLGCRPRATHQWYQSWRQGAGLETIWAASCGQTVESRLAGLGALGALPLIETLKGERLSLQGLAALERGELIAIWRDGPLWQKRAQLRALDVPCCLWVDKREAGLLNKLLGQDYLNIQEEHVHALLARAEFLAKPLWSEPARDDAELIEVTLERDGIRARLRMLNPHQRVFERHREQLALVDVIYEQRKLCEQEVALPFGLFLGEVVVEGIKCSSGYDEVVQDRRWARACEVILEAAAQAWRRWLEARRARAAADEEPTTLWLLWQLHAWSLREDDPLGLLSLLEGLPSYHIKRLGAGDEGVISEQWLTRVQLVEWATRQGRVLTLRRGAHVEVSAQLDAGAQLLEVFEPVLASHEVFGELFNVPVVLQDVWQLLDAQARRDAAKRHFMVQAPVPLKLQSPNTRVIYVPIDDEHVRGYLALKPVEAGASPVDELTLCFEERRAHELKRAGQWLVFSARVVLDSAHLMDWTRSAQPDEQVIQALVERAEREVLSAVEARLREPEMTVVGLEWLRVLLEHGHRRGMSALRELRACLEGAPLFELVSGVASYRELKAQRARLCWTWRRDHELGGLMFDADVVLRPPSPAHLSLYRELFDVLPELKASTTPSPAPPATINKRRREITPPESSPAAAPAQASPTPALLVQDVQALDLAVEVEPDDAFIVAERQWWAQRWRGLAVAMPQRMSHVEPVRLGADGVLARVHQGQAQLNMDHLVVRQAQASEPISRYMLMMGLFSAINVFEEPITDEDELALLGGLIAQLEALNLDGGMG